MPPLHDTRCHIHEISIARSYGNSPTALVRWLTDWLTDSVTSHAIHQSFVVPPPLSPPLWFGSLGRGLPTCRYLQPNRVCAFEFQTVVSSIDSVTTHLLHYILLLLGSSVHLPSTKKKTSRFPREMMKHRRLTQSFTEFVIDSLETNSECNAEQQRDPTRPDRLVSTIVRSWRRRRRYKYSNLCTVPDCHPLVVW